MIKRTSSGILTRGLKGTSFIHKLIVQKHIPAKHPQEIRAGYNVNPGVKKVHSLRRLENVFFGCYSVCEKMKDTKEG